MPAPRPTYHPYLNGVYRTEMGLQKLQDPQGNGPVDGYYFQRDADFDQYIAAKRSAAAEDPARCFYTDGLDGQNALNKPTLVLIYNLIRSRLQTEWAITLPHSPSIAALEDAAYQMQEDFTIVTRSETGDRLAVAAVALPSGWDPAVYVGRSWLEIHQEIPGLAHLNSKSDRIVGTITKQGPYKRFVWGLQFDATLDRNPRRYASSAFDGQEFYVRVERQVLHPFPEQRAVLFLIRPYLIHSSEIQKDQAKRRALKAGLLSMTPESREYKGVARDFEKLMDFLT